MLFSPKIVRFRHESMALQTGVSTSKVLILVGAGNFSTYIYTHIHIHIHIYIYMISLCLSLCLWSFYCCCFDLLILQISVNWILYSCLLWFGTSIVLKPQNPNLLQNCISFLYHIFTQFNFVPLIYLNSILFFWFFSIFCLFQELVLVHLWIDGIALLIHYVILNWGHFCQFTKNSLN